MREVQISEDALEDRNNGQLFYEAQEPGLGEYFTACLRADTEGLRVSAGVHRVVYHDFFVKNYPEPIFENGIQLFDMLRLTLRYSGNVAYPFIQADAASRRGLIQVFGPDRF